MLDLPAERLKGAGMYCYDNTIRLQTLFHDSRQKFTSKIDASTKKPIPIKMRHGIENFEKKANDIRIPKRGSIPKYLRVVPYLFWEVITPLQ